MLSDVHTVDVSYRRTRPWCPIDPWPFHSFMCCMWNSLSWPNHMHPSGSVAVWVIHAHHSRSMAVCHTILSLFVLLDDWVNCLVWFIIFGTASLTFDQNNCMHCIFRLFCWTYQFPLTSCKIWVVKIHWVDVLVLDGSVCYKTKNVDLNSWAHYKGYCSGIEVFYSGLLLNYHTHHVIHVGFVVPRWGHLTCRWCCATLGGSIILFMAHGSRSTQLHSSDCPYLWSELTALASWLSWWLLYIGQCLRNHVAGHHAHHATGGLRHALNKQQGHNIFLCAIHNTLPPLPNTARICLHIHCPFGSIVVSYHHHLLQVHYCSCCLSCHCCCSHILRIGHCSRCLSVHGCSLVHYHSCHLCHSVSKSMPPHTHCLIHCSCNHHVHHCVCQFQFLLPLHQRCHCGCPSSRPCSCHCQEGFICSSSVNSCSSDSAVLSSSVFYVLYYCDCTIVVVLILYDKQKRLKALPL